MKARRLLQLMMAWTAGLLTGVGATSGIPERYAIMFFSASSILMIVASLLTETK